MHRITFNSDSYTLPGKWDELTPQQLLAVAKIMLTDSQWDNIKTRLALYFLGLRVMRRKTVMIDSVEHFYVKHGIRKVYLLSAFDLEALGNALSFLTEKPNAEGQRMLRPRVRKQPFASLKIRLRKLTGCADGLTDMLFGEFVFAETYYYRYLTTHDEMWFNRLLAILYRKTKNGKKQEFSEETIERNARLFAYLPPYKKLAMRFYYDGCKEFLAAKYPETLGGGGSGKAKDPFEDFHKLTVALASADPTKAEDVRNSLLYDALESFEQSVKKQQHQPQH